MPTVPQHLGRNLRRIRRALGMTQERFCEAAGLSQSYLSELETGKAWGPIERLCEQIKTAGGDPAELVRPGEDDADPVSRDLARVARGLDDDARRDLLAIARRMQR